jgi:hypothetical protein
MTMHQHRRQRAARAQCYHPAPLQQSLEGREVEGDRECQNGSEQIGAGYQLLGAQRFQREQRDNAHQQRARDALERIEAGERLARPAGYYQ